MSQSQVNMSPSPSARATEVASGPDRKGLVNLLRRIEADGNRGALERAISEAESELFNSEYLVRRRRVEEARTALAGHENANAKEADRIRSQLAAGIKDADRVRQETLRREIEAASQNLRLKPPEIEPCLVKDAMEVARHETKKAKLYGLQRAAAMELVELTRRLDAYVYVTNPRDEIETVRKEFHRVIAQLSAQLAEV